MARTSGGPHPYDGPARRSTADAFVAAPPGRYVAGRTFVYGCVDRELFVTVLLGRPEENEMRTLMQLYEVELSARCAPHESLLDCSRMTAVDLPAYTVFADYLASQREARARMIRRQAIVRPAAALAGATIVGYGKLAPAKHPARIFGTLEAALEWLGRDAAGAARVGALLGEVTAVDPVLAALRAQLSAAPRSTLHAAAKALSLSDRSLQRRLLAEGTTFRAEIARAQVDLAKRLLIESDLKLVVVALQIGCASSQHFSDLFRRWTGQAPSAWRAQNRAAPQRTASPK